MGEGPKFDTVHLPLTSIVIRTHASCTSRSELVSFTSIVMAQYCLTSELKCKMVYPTWLRNNAEMSIAYIHWHKMSLIDNRQHLMAGPIEICSDKCNNCFLEWCRTCQAWSKAVYSDQIIPTVSVASLQKSFRTYFFNSSSNVFSFHLFLLHKIFSPS